VSAVRTVGINGLFLDTPHTGTGVYTREVLARLLGNAPDSAAQSRDAGLLRYVLFGHPEHAADYSRRVPYLRLQAPLRRRLENAEKVLWEQAVLPLAAWRQGVDLLYAPYFSLPLFAGARTVVTVHDVIPLALPEYAPSRALRAYFRLVGAAVRKADRVVTDSHHAAGDIERLLGVPAERICVIYLGVDRRYTLPPDPAHLDAVRARLNLPERFILYVGGVDPRKNLTTLLRARRLVRERRQTALPLVIVAPLAGPDLPQWRAVNPRLVAAAEGVEGGVIFLDWVSDAEKAALYALATAFVYPSRYEGFGLPILEAMAAGTPVVASRASSLPEVAGDAALLLDPDDAAAWADALVRIGEDEALRADLVARGAAQARRFTWDATAAALEGVFRDVLAT
jgi:glycosyltransferase involved in cell wall biosynthesis